MSSSASSSSIEEGAQSGYAEHLHWCEHVKQHVKGIGQEVVSNIDFEHNQCEECDNTGENWLCLQCHRLLCGRFARGHLASHRESSGHMIAAGLTDISFWCEACDSYLYHRTIPALYRVYAALYRGKFGEDPPDPPLASTDPMDEALRSSSISVVAVGQTQSSSSSASASASSSASSSSSAPAAAATSAPSSTSVAKTEGKERMTSDDGGRPSKVSKSGNTDDAATSATTHTDTGLSAPLSALSLPSSSTPSSTSASSSSASNPPTHGADSTSSSSLLCPIVGLDPSLLQEDWVNRLCGTLYGNALGDAFGLATEFLSKREVQKLYGPTYDPASGEGAINFPDYIKTRHSSRWTSGDWTDDTDQMMLILDTFLETFSGSKRHSTDLVPNAKLFGKKLLYWAEHGVPELGDKGGMGLGALTRTVLIHPLFVKDPHGAARDVWERSNCKAAANGGVMRTSVTGVFDYKYLDRVIRNTKEMCKCTHADPRCVASCVLVATLIAEILNGAKLDTPESVEALIERCLGRTLSEVELGEHQDLFNSYVGMKDLAEMELDEPRSIGYTLKCMASGLYGLRSTESFIVTLTRLIREAGDADTNGAVCGALYGAKVGYTHLPQRWLASMPFKEWMDRKVVKLIQLCMDREKAANSNATASEQKGGIRGFISGLFKSSSRSSSSNEAKQQEGKAESDVKP